MIDIKTRFNRQPRKGLTFAKPSLTQQQFRDECDLQLLIERCTSAGVPLPSVPPTAKFVDTTLSPQSLQEAMQTQRNLSESWDALPAKIKQRFGSPMALYEFCCNDENRDEAIKLGLVNKPIVDVDVVPPGASVPVTVTPPAQPAQPVETATPSVAV